MPSVLLTLSLMFLWSVEKQNCLPSSLQSANQRDLAEKSTGGTNFTLGNSDCSSRDCDGRLPPPPCGPASPVRVNQGCVRGSRLSSPCNYSEQCQHYDRRAVCVETGPGQSRCGCSAGWSVRRSGEGEREVCSAEPPQSPSDQLATLLGLGLGLTGLTALLCFTFRLFSKARTVETRGYGDASQPPQLLVEGVDVSQDVENCSRTSSKSRIYTPGPPLTPSQVRRMSELSSLSVTVQEKDFTVRPVSPGAPGSVGGSLDLLFERDEAVEHQLTIIPRLGSFKRRKSLVNHAFPELHRKPTNGSNSLVILTKTRTDGEGRRHSVAVPLLATPPQSQAGLVIERRGRRTGERRHSLQVTARSPRRQNSSRQSSRRPSRQGFYQFLEQAVAT